MRTHTHKHIPKHKRSHKGACRQRARESFTLALCTLGRTCVNPLRATHPHPPYTVPATTATRRKLAPHHRRRARIIIIFSVRARARLRCVQPPLCAVLCTNVRYSRALSHTHTHNELVHCCAHIPLTGMQSTITAM